MSSSAFGFVAALAVVVPASLAWACVAPVSLTTATPTVQPGGTVHIIGRETAPGAPIEIRLNSARRAAPRHGHRASPAA